MFLPLKEHAGFCLHSTAGVENQSEDIYSKLKLEMMIFGACDGTARKQPPCGLRFESRAAGFPDVSGE